MATFNQARIHLHHGKAVQGAGQVTCHLGASPLYLMALDASGVPLRCATYTPPVGLVLTVAGDGTHKHPTVPVLLSSYAHHQIVLKSVGEWLSDGFQAVAHGFGSSVQVNAQLNGQPEGVLEAILSDLAARAGQPDAEEILLIVPSIDEDPLHG